MINILYIIETLATGGKERRLLELIKYLSKYSDIFKISLVVLDDKKISYDYRFSKIKYCTLRLISCCYGLY